MSAFTPIGNTVNVSATTSSGNVALTLPSWRDSFDVRGVNGGTTLAFVNFGTDNAVTAATATSVPIAGGAERVFRVNPATTHMAAIMSSSTGTIYATTGRVAA